MSREDEELRITSTEFVKPNVSVVFSSNNAKRRVHYAGLESVEADSASHPDEVALSEADTRVSTAFYHASSCPATESCPAQAPGPPGILPSHCYRRYW